MMTFPAASLYPLCELSHLPDLMYFHKYKL